MIIRTGLLLGFLLFIGGCAAVDIDDYRAERPLLDLKSYFSGIIDGHGSFRIAVARW